MKNEKGELQNSRSIQLAIAPIGWTNDDLPELGGDIPFEQCISEMALAGYLGCEIGNKFPDDPQTLKHYLNLRGLQVCNQWFSYELTTKSWVENKEAFAEHLDFLATMNCTIVGGGEVGNSCQGRLDIPVFEGKGMLNSQEEWKKFTFSLNELGKMAQDKGLKLSFHHHMGTCIQTLDETLRLLDMTDERYVGLNYDCGHFYFSGEDPVEALQKCLPRVTHVHLKDIRPNVLHRVKEERMSFLAAVKTGVFTVPGDPEGCIDFDPIFTLLKENGYRGWWVVEAEQDPYKANPYEYALIARNFIRERTGL